MFSLLLFLSHDDNDVDDVSDGTRSHETSYYCCNGKEDDGGKDSIVNN